MSIDFTKLEYVSSYGSDYYTSGLGVTIRVVGSLSIGASAYGTVTFEAGYPQVSTEGSPDYKPPVALPNPTILQYVMGDTPNDPTKWYDINVDPRPLTFPTSGGNINLTMYKYRSAYSTSAPTSTTFVYVLDNTTGVAVTFDYSFRAAFYALANT